MLFINGIKIRDVIIFACGLGFLSLLSQCNPITSEETDISRQCIKFDFESAFNLTIQRKIVAVYNSALCKRCLPKLLAFKAVQLRFELADFNDIQFIMLTTEKSNTKQFAELQSRAGDVLVLSLHDIENEFFVAGSVNVFDKCGRLTYDFLQLWSEARYQLIKAAILSTLYDAPCGKCIENNDESDLNDLLGLEEDLLVTTETAAGSTTEAIENVQTETERSSDYDDNDELYNLHVQANDSDVAINMRVIVPLEHVHRLENGTYEKYNLIVFESKDSSSSVNRTEPHEHFSSDRAELLYDEENVNVISTNDSHVPEYLHGSDGQRFKVSLTKFDSNKTEKPIEQPHLEYLEVSAIHDIDVVTPSFSLKPQTNSDGSVSPMISENLKKWLSYRLLSPFYKLS